MSSPEASPADLVGCVRLCTWVEGVVAPVVVCGPSYPTHRIRAAKRAKIKTGGISCFESWSCRSKEPEDGGSLKPF